MPIIICLSGSEEEAWTVNTEKITVRDALARILAETAAEDYAADVLRQYDAVGEAYATNGPEDEHWYVIES